MRSTIAFQRLHNQRLEGTKFKSPGEVVAWMGAVQGQEYPYAKWALGLRIGNATDEVVDSVCRCRMKYKYEPLRY